MLLLQFASQFLLTVLLSADRAVHHWQCLLAAATVIMIAIVIYNSAVVWTGHGTYSSCWCMQDKAASKTLLTRPGLIASRSEQKIQAQCVCITRKQKKMKKYGKLAFKTTKRSSKQICKQNKTKQGAMNKTNLIREVFLCTVVIAHDSYYHQKHIHNQL